MKYLSILLFLSALLLTACSTAQIVMPETTQGLSQPQTTSEAISATQAPTHTADTAAASLITPEPAEERTAAPTPHLMTTPHSGPTSSPAPCINESGKVTRLTLPTDMSIWEWNFRIYTPPCYEMEPDRYYPLLILIHGSTYTDSQWDELGADETADELIRSGQAPPFLILMPRDRVMTDPLEDPFGEALVRRILPWVEGNYRAIPGKDYRAIGGLSRGASWAIHLGLKYPGFFSSIGAHSLPVFATDPPRLTRWLDNIPPEKMPRFYLDIGEKDFLLEKAQWFSSLLTSRNVEHEWHLNPGDHEEAYWAEHLEEYLLWYTAPWQP